MTIPANKTQLDALVQEVASLKAQVMQLRGQIVLLESERPDGGTYREMIQPIRRGMHYSFKLFRREGQLYRAGGRRCVVDHPWEELSSHAYGAVVDGNVAWMRYKYTKLDSSGNVIAGTGEWDEGYDSSPPEVNADQMVWIFGSVNTVSGSTDETWVNSGWVGDIIVLDIMDC